MKRGHVRKTDVQDVAIDAEFVRTGKVNWLLASSFRWCNNVGSIYRQQCLPGFFFVSATAPA